jgi:hypothetical protein
MALRGGSEKKHELTPLIDVIFLLLIFFLVTMSIIPGMVEPHKPEYIVPSEVPGFGGVTADMLIQLCRSSGEKIWYVVMDSNLPSHVFRNCGQMDLRCNPNQLRVVFPHHVFQYVEEIRFFSASTAIIRADEWTPYEEVIKVVRRCQDNGVSFFLAKGSVETMCDDISIDPTPSECRESLP